MQICILPIKRATRKIRRLASAELWTTSNDEVVVVGCFEVVEVVSN